jgi:hypothetical protein
MTSKPRKRPRSNSEWTEVVAMIMRVFAQVNEILYDWLRGGPGGAHH